MTNQDAAMMNVLIVTSASVLLFCCVAGVYLSFKIMELRQRIYHLEDVLTKVLTALGPKNPNSKSKMPAGGRYKFKTEVLYCKMDGTLIKRIQGFEPYGNPLNFASIFSEETGTILSNNFKQSDDPEWNGQVLAVCEKSDAPEYAKHHGLRPIGYLYFQYDN